MWGFLQPIAYLLGIKDNTPKKDPGGWKPEWSQYIKNAYYNRPDLEASFDQAKDIKTLRPDWFTLSTAQKCEVLAAFWKAIALYESDYNPKCASVDVGTPNNKDTWSIGLLQMSVIDQSNYGLRLGYNYNTLLEPTNNLYLGMLVMDKQLKRRGRIFIPQGDIGTYWATIHPGGRYDKSSQIIKLVQAVKFDTVPKT